MITANYERVEWSAASEVYKGQAQNPDDLTQADELGAESFLEELDFPPGSWLCRCRSVVYAASQGELRPFCTNYWRGTVCGLVRASGDTGWVPRAPTPLPASREAPAPKAASAAPAAPASPALHPGNRVVHEVDS